MRAFLTFPQEYFAGIDWQANFLITRTDFPGVSPPLGTGSRGGKRTGPEARGFSRAGCFYALKGLPAANGADQVLYGADAVTVAGVGEAAEMPAVVPRQNAGRRECL
jgi:hypothetical protein